MTAAPQAGGRHIVCMTKPGGASSELTAELAPHEAQAALRALHQLLASASAMAEGWTAEPVAHGFQVSKGAFTATFMVAAAGTVDLSGRLRLLSGRERMRPLPGTA